ncbi:hypothetical protein ColTof3_14293 [Colletotrichum tofieldiae]|nr:hypothetical protein ColTof3_14293 [Colletotrichum tofieldiae]
MPRLTLPHTIDWREEEEEELRLLSQELSQIALELPSPNIYQITLFFFSLLSTEYPFGEATRCRSLGAHKSGRLREPHAIVTAVTRNNERDRQGPASREGISENADWLDKDDEDLLEVLVAARQERWQGG